MITENLKAHFLRLYQMALSDDEFSELELKMLYKFAEEREVPREDLDKILLYPMNYKTLIPNELGEKISYLFDLTKMIWADGVVSPNERTTLEKYIELFDFLPENKKEIADYFIQSVEQGKTEEEILKEITD